jgi:hypothetical protein
MSVGEKWPFILELQFPLSANELQFAENGEENII